MAGGANPNAGDAGAIFVFRYVAKPDGSEEPVVYHLNMMRPGTYLLSQRFLMRDRDVLYVGNARANQLTKFAPVEPAVRPGRHRPCSHSIIQLL